MYRGRHLWIEAFETAESIRESLVKIPGVVSAVTGGSIRRRRETVKDIDILSVVPENKRKTVSESVRKMPLVHEITGSGGTKISLVTKSGIACDIRMVESGEEPYALHHFTGSREHNTAMRSRAQRMGLKMNEYGLWRGDELIKCASEEELFSKLGLQFIPPELREDMGEIEAAEKDELPNLVENKHLKGVLHVHTTWSDGRNTIDEMAIEAKKLGFTYIGISDHSRSAAYAGGLGIEKLKEQITAARKAEDAAGIRVLVGTESDILPDGSLDFPAEVLESLDFVIGSVHSSFGMSRNDMTARIVKALRNPRLSILGHPTGRLLLAREPYEIDMETVLKESASNGVALELNANPHRLDLDWRLCREAKKLGIKIAISPDAHVTDGLSDTYIGVGIARKGWLEPKDVLNAFPLEDLLRIIRKRT